MPAGLAGDDRTCQIRFQVQIDRPGDVCLLIAALSVLGVIEGETAVDDAQVRLRELRVQSCGIDQLSKRHGKAPFGLDAATVSRVVDAADECAANGEARYILRAYSPARRS